MYRSIRHALGAVTTALASTLMLTACSDGSPEYQLTSYVPADTIMYSAQTDPELAKPYARLTNDYFQGFATILQGWIDVEKATEAAGPAGGLGAALYQRALDRVADGGKWFKGMGIRQAGPRGLYTVGAIPVIRMAVSDRERFWGEISQAEDQAGVDADTTDDGATKLRRYPLSFDGMGDRELDLVITTRDGYAIATLAGSGVRDETLALALGKNRPEESLADTDKLTTISQDHGTRRGATGFIDHQQLIDGLTDPSANRFGDMLAGLVEAWGGSSALLDPVRSSACRNDLQAIADRWPYTATGITEVDADAGKVNLRMAVATTDKATTTSLQAARGHIPEPTTGRPIYGVGVGLKTGQLAATAEELSGRLRNADFDCPALAAMQQRADKARLRQLRMAERMLGDVRGFGVALRELDLGGSGSKQFNADAIAEVATPKPESLWRLIQSSAGLPKDSTPQPGGDPVGVKLPVMAPVELQVAIRENSLMALTGNAKLDSAAGESDLKPNGMLRLSSDYGRALEALAASGQWDGTNGADLPSAEAAKQVNAYYDMRLDVADEAITIDMAIDLAGDE